MILACAAGLMIALAAPSRGQTASGVFQVQPGGSISPKVAAAFPVRDRGNARETAIEVVLSAAPADVAAAAADLVPHTAVINDPALLDADYVLVWIRPDGSVSMNATFGKTMTQFLDRARESGPFRAELTTNTPERIAGRIFTTSPVKTLEGATYTVDLTFSTPVTRPPAGTPLPSGGGEPGAALSAFLVARQEKDWAGLKAALSPRMTAIFVKQYNDDNENLTDALQTLEFWLPVTDVTITRGTLLGEVAVLDVEGALASGVRALSLVRLIKGPSRWLFDRAAVVGMLP